MKIFILGLFLFMTCSICFAQNIDYAALEKEFTADTARVEQAYRNSTDYSTMGMIQSLNKYEEDYDGLLNKYYKELMTSLDEDGRKVLRESQRSWMKLRDNDREVVRTLHSKTYDESGGGTIWGVVSADYIADITKRRVLDLYRYLMFGDIGGR